MVPDLTTPPTCVDVAVGGVGLVRAATRSRPDPFDKFWSVPAGAPFTVFPAFPSSEP